MNSITKDYLTDIIIKKIAEDISIHRKAKQQAPGDEHYPCPTDEEVLDFIIAIPYFDDKLKDFLIGNLMETTIIISQSWENEFNKKTASWAESAEWLYGEDAGALRPGEAGGGRQSSFLSLPY
jgi:hypothetical protein